MAFNRQQEFLQRLKDKTTTTYKILLDVQEIDHDLMRVLDKHTINSLYDEKILLFDSAGNNIYSSVDDTRILFPLEVIKDLKDGEDDVFYNEDGYEVYAHTILDHHQKFYAIGKAYDKYGRSKMRFLAWTLFVIYLLMLVIVILVSYYISKRITHPITRLTDEVNIKNIDNLTRVEVPPTHDEIATLALGFNNMLSRVEESYAYQKNFIQHMSHELKTPIAVLISNIERTLTEGTPDQWRASFEFQKNGLMQMASVINTLLDISRYETRPDLLFTQNVRIDELLFECMEGLTAVYPKTRFDLSIHEQFSDAGEIVCSGNERMLYIAFFNLIKNASEYSDDDKVTLLVRKDTTHLQVDIGNHGEGLSAEEQQYLFRHFFRGQNSRSKTGIGLGLVMAHKIFQLHQGTIVYTYTPTARQNLFTVTLPLP